MSDKSGNIGDISIFLLALQFSILLLSHISEKIFGFGVMGAIGTERLKLLLLIIIHPLSKCIEAILMPNSISFDGRRGGLIP
ncbi:MAG: hypothetical protein JRI42_01465 [Deltaproteobacteria bacterium]|nr:hypothetical protein [Deltaproteobacteria bacterium]MBW2001896.1 hypothetical protein [Deltaproteobacteria bacterium]